MSQNVRCYLLEEETQGGGGSGFLAQKEGRLAVHSLSFRLHVVWKAGGLMLFPPVSVLPVGMLRDQRHVQASSATDTFLSPENE